MSLTEILNLIPQQPPFRFVDAFTEADEQRISGHYTFREDAYFYQGHFPGHPITPGVILTECMAQIALVGHAIYLQSLKGNLSPGGTLVFTHAEVDFLLPVYPGEKVRVQGARNYFRFNKMSTQAEMYNREERLVCKGKLEGMVTQLKAIAG